MKNYFFITFLGGLISMTLATPFANGALAGRSIGFEQQAEANLTAHLSSELTDYEFKQQSSALFKELVKESFYIAALGDDVED